MQDSQGAIVDFFFSQHLTQDGEDFESMAQSLSPLPLMMWYGLPDGFN